MFEEIIKCFFFYCRYSKSHSRSIEFHVIHPIIIYTGWFEMSKLKLTQVHAQDWKLYTFLLA